MSAQKRDFPVTSIGRSQGARVQQQQQQSHHGQSVASHEAHPLLGAGSPLHSPQISPTSSPSVGAATGTGARYKPYTPRQRAPQATATTTTVHPPSPSHLGGDTATATSKLQMMHLKAAAQSVGLDTGTLGWVMLEKLLDSEVSVGSGGKKEQEEWAEVWSLLTSNKATLLLPLSSHEKISITPELFRDHIILCVGPGRKNGQFITLSGIRGTLDESSLTIQTTLPRASPTFSSLLSLIPTATGGSSPTVTQLPPLPYPLPHANFPHINLVSYTASLPLPPRNLHPHAAQKPPLPPRPGPRPSASASSSVASATPSRIPNPFASLFGAKHTPTPSTSSTSSAPSPALPLPAPASPPTSLRSLDSTEMPPPPVVVDVQAYTIHTPLRMQDVAREVLKSVDKAVEEGLEGVPAWVKVRVAEFVQDLAPFVKSANPPLPSRGDKEKGEKEKHDHEIYTPNPFSEPPEEIAGRLQDWYVSLEEELRVWVRKNEEALRRNASEHYEDAMHEKKEEEDMDEREREFMRLEEKMKDVMECVESVICEVFYDRLFMQPTTDDASHDEALSSHVAALNMLDLTLGHLDIEVPNAAKAGVDGVVTKCGEALSQLEAAHSPVEKAAILVEAHKIVVDGLSRLPPVRLKTEEEKAASSKVPSIDEFEDDLPTARPFVAKEEVELQVKNTVISETNGETTAASATTAVQSTLFGRETVVSPVDSSLLHSPLHQSSRSLSPVGGVSASSSPQRPRPATLPLSSPSSSPMPRTGSLPAETTESKHEKNTPVSGDVLLPMIIFSVVKANPPHLVSHLLFTQRFRNQSIGGEESYCLINLLAVAEFLENVDLAALGFSDSERVMSTADLTPIQLTRSPVTSEAPLAPADANSLRGRMEQQVDAIADSANKVISGVVDSSFGMLRSFLPNNNVSTEIPAVEAPRPGLGLLRKESAFSIASIAASLPIAGRKPQQNGEEAGQQLVTVSRPGSVKSRSRAGSVASGLKIHIEGSESESVESGVSASETEDDDDEENEGEEHDAIGADGKSMRSIRSFESMMSASRERRERKADGTTGKTKDSSTKRSGSKPITMPMPRKSLTDRLAHMSQSALAGFKNSPPNLLAGTSADTSSPVSSRPSSPAPPPLRLAPPIQRFVDCNPEDLRLGEINELLRDYKRLVEGIKMAHGFIDWD